MKNYSVPNTQTVIHIVYKSKQASCSSSGSDLPRPIVYGHHQNEVRQLVPRRAATLLARPADERTSKRYISYQDVALSTSLLTYLGMWFLSD